MSTAYKDQGLLDLARRYAAVLTAASEMRDAVGVEAERNAIERLASVGAVAKADLVRAMLADHREKQIALQDSLSELEGGDPPVRRGIIYGIRMGQTIKLGYSTRLATRLADYPPHEVLFLVESTYRNEQLMHALFTQHLIQGKEWYQDCQEIRDFVDQVIAAGFDIRHEFGMVPEPHGVSNGG